MFPPSLQKNIRELDRQISLLETECENMEAENRDATGKPSAKAPPSGPPPGHSPKAPPAPPKRVHSLCGARKGPPGEAESGRRSERKESSEGSEGSCQEREVGERRGGVEGRRACKRSLESLREVTESSEDGYPIRIEISNAKQRSNPTEAPKEQKIWCELPKEQVLADRKQSKSPESFLRKNPAEPKFSSDEELSRVRHFLSKEKWPKEVERPLTPQSKTSSKRRPRSARTRKNVDEVPLDVNITKAIQEKEIQCIMWNEEREKAEFLLNLNESIRTLHLLIEELKTKSTREKRNDLLKDMQSTLMKIGGMKSMNTLQGSLSMVKGSKARPVEGEESAADLKKALVAVKKFCQELSEEKSSLTEELSAKNSMISSLRSKEKDYLVLISNLKFNLERLREEVEEGQLAKRDLSVLKGKLREEGKVIEALKKSHGKMQALIEHYVLENDKLRAEVKMGKLEAQKFHVLLAGKEAEIKKRKEEIELFQRQITQQLSLLRSKATENEVEKAIEAISNQTTILQTEATSVPSETTVDKGEVSAAFELMETTSSNRTQGEFPKRGEQRGCRGAGGAKGGAEGGAKEGKQGGESEESGREKHYGAGLNGVLSRSKTLRSSINEMLQGMRRGSSEKFWASPANSSNTSRCSVASSYSENASERSRKD